MQVINMRNLPLDQYEYDLKKKYFQKYYFDCFKLNQGTDIILETIKSFCPGGRWLDVGCGSSTLFWSLMTQEIESITCSDISIEALKILYDIVNDTNDPPNCYSDVIKMYKLSNDIFDKNKKKIKEFIVFDSLKEWPIEIYKKAYDFITEFGVFGLSNNGKSFRECFNYLKKALAINGVAIGANWVLSKQYSQQRNHNNSYINCSEVTRACKESGLLLLRCVEVSIIDDPCYERVIIWAAQNILKDE